MRQCEFKKEGTTRKLGWQKMYWKRFQLQKKYFILNIVSLKFRIFHVFATISNYRMNKMSANICVEFIVLEKNQKLSVYLSVLCVTCFDSGWESDCVFVCVTMVHNVYSE